MVRCVLAKDRDAAGRMKALRESLLDHAGTICTRTPRLPRGRTARAVLAAVVLPLLLAVPADGPALAQAIPSKPLVDKKTGAPERMLLEADELVYDNDGNSVTALGTVQVYYAGYRLTARKVTFFRQTRRVVAEGEARLVEPTGNVVTADKLDVTEGFETGFVSSLAVESIERSRFTARSAERKDGNVTVFEEGAYSACQACVTRPDKPPFWQIRAAKIIHNQTEQMVYYEDARLEFSGVPIAYVPFFTHPDPTVRRKTGFLVPGFLASTQLGAGAQVPFFWAPTNDWDVTLSPVALSKQGLLGDIEVRHRMETGSFSIRGVGINQNDPSVFAGTSGEREWRGALFSKGTYYINKNWTWGWDLTETSDRKFIKDYHLTSADGAEAVSTVFLTGLGERNYFDLRAYKFQIFEDDDPTKANGAGLYLQEKQPYVHPVLDYDYIHPDPVLGGELSASLNLTSLTRDKTDMDIAKQVYGLSGTYTRLSLQAMWRRQYIDRIGQVFTPFLQMKGDLFFNNNTDPTVPWVSDGTLARFMPAAGVEWRYPFIATGPLGSHVFEPIAQIVARTDETYIGRLPNEDAQSLVFDTTSLFDIDKFSGFDRTEGGTRGNVGLRYTFMADGGGSVTALIGQSYHLAGRNSFATPDIAALVAMANSRPLTGLGSGLESDESDYVASMLVDSGRGLRIGAAARFDNHDFTINRAEVQATGLAGPFTASVTYAYLKTPSYLYQLIDPANWGQIESERSEIQSSLNLRLTDNWRMFGGVRYDIRNSFLVNNTLGIGYDNDSFSASLAYAEDTDRAQTKQGLGTRVLTDRVLYFRFGLRTLGDGSVSNSLIR